MDCRGRMNLTSGSPWPASPATKSSPSRSSSPATSGKNRARGDVDCLAPSSPPNGGLGLPATRSTLFVGLVRPRPPAGPAPVRWRRERSAVLVPGVGDVAAAAGAEVDDPGLCATPSAALSNDSCRLSLTPCRSVSESTGVPSGPMVTLTVARDKLASPSGVGVSDGRPL